VAAAGAISIPATPVSPAIRAAAYTTPTRRDRVIRIGTMIDHGKPIAPNSDSSAPASACETPAMSTRTTGSQAKHA
jgi:hypothetical protein